MDKRSPLYWENWNRRLFFFPISFVWVWYIIRSRSVWFFTPSNPSITFGGMDGEPKEEIHNRIPPNMMPAGFFMYPGECFEILCERLHQHGISFPLVVKPQMGKGGVLFRRLEHEEQLRTYHQLVDVPFIVQAFSHYPVEVSVFYFRMPGEVKGTVSGFLHKTPMRVQGDGRHTLKQLVKNTQEGTKHYADLMRHNHHREDEVPAEGEWINLNYTANRSNGGRFYNLEAQIDKQLTETFDAISAQMGDWFFGRYDIMCESVDALKQGRGYTILEYNGAGASPNHIFFSDKTLWQAYAEILYHWRWLYRISKKQMEAGINPWPTFKGYKFLRKTIKRLNHLERLEKLLPF